MVNMDLRYEARYPKSKQLVVTEGESRQMGKGMRKFVRNNEKKGNGGIGDVRKSKAELTCLKCYEKGHLIKE